MLVYQRVVSVLSADFISAMCCRKTLSAIAKAQLSSGFSLRSTLLAPHLRERYGRTEKRQGSTKVIQSSGTTLTGLSKISSASHFSEHLKQISGRTGTVGAQQNCCCCKKGHRWQLVVISRYLRQQLHWKRAVLFISWDLGVLTGICGWVEEVEDMNHCWKLGLMWVIHGNSMSFLPPMTGNGLYHL